MNLETILLTAGVVGGIALVCAAALALAAHFFFVASDPRAAALEALLPGINCGACGYAGCSDYAQAIAQGDAAVDRCAPGGADVLQALSEATGVAAAAAERQVAFVHCGGDASKALHRHAYNGVPDCSAAHNLAGGDLVCAYGCLGYGSCARVCPVHAIEMCENLAVVHPDLCIGCKACVAACPRSLIRMVPANQYIHVRCSSRDKGPIAKKACQVACIGCRICAKLDAEAFVMDGFLAKRNYEVAAAHPEVVDKCPGHCIVNAQPPQGGQP